MAYSNEFDRKSTVSSFYRGRRESFDALNADAPITPSVAGDRSRHDDASSFYDPHQAGRRSADPFSHSAGYNRSSYFDAGRTAPVKGIQDDEEMALGGNGGAGDNGWDAYADFNNAGPRYTTLFQSQDIGYQQLPTPGVHTPSIKQDAPSLSGPVEMITVPAMGAEWKKSELKDMKNKGKTEIDTTKYTDHFRRWRRDQTGCCGKWGTRKHVAIGSFALAVVIGIILAVTLPRVPGVIFANPSPLTNGSLPVNQTFLRVPANFSFNSAVQLQVDTSSNVIPLRMTSMSANVFDLDTNRLVGTGHMGSHTFPANKFVDILLPLNFSYVGPNDTDQTWLDWYNACNNAALHTDGQRPGVDFRLSLSMNLAGLIGSRATSLSITNVGCPFELPINAV